RSCLATFERRYGFYDLGALVLQPLQLLRETIVAIPKDSDRLPETVLVPLQSLALAREGRQLVVDRGQPLVLVVDVLLRLGELLRDLGLLGSRSPELVLVERKLLGEPLGFELGLV